MCKIILKNHAVKVICNDQNLLRVSIFSWHFCIKKTLVICQILRHSPIFQHITRNIPEITNDRFNNNWFLLMALNRVASWTFIWIFPSLEIRIIAKSLVTNIHNWNAKKKNGMPKCMNEWGKIVGEKFVGHVMQWHFRILLNFRKL